MHNEPLFDMPVKRKPRGIVRRGLDNELTRARKAGKALPPDIVALARTLADAVDSESEPLRARVAAAALYADTRASLFGREDADGADPFAAFLADISTPTMGDAPTS